MIGEGIARALAAKGATVVVWDVSGEPPAEGIAFRSVDVTKADAVQAAVDEVLSSHGRIDIEHLGRLELEVTGRRAHAGARRRKKRNYER